MKMKVHKVTLIIVDHDDLGAKEVKAVLENTNYPNHCMVGLSILDIKTKEVDNYNDDHPLNKIDSHNDFARKLFRDGYWDSIIEEIKSDVISKINKEKMENWFLEGWKAAKLSNPKEKPEPSKVGKEQREMDIRAIAANALPEKARRVGVRNLYDRIDTLEAENKKQTKEIEKLRGKSKTLICKWICISEDENLWSTECDHAFQITNGTPIENRMSYCPYCGGDIEQAIKGKRK
jgi:hypothetical protein